MSAVLGKKVKDKITGFEGIATGYVQYLTGCNQVLVTPKIGKSGEHKEPHWFDEQRLTVDSKVKAVKLDNGKNPGPDKAAPTKS
jgi:hypothetical protein